MSKSRRRKSLAAATVVAIVAIAQAATLTTAHASHAGTGSILTASSGDSTIAVAGGAAIQVGETVEPGAQWSPDGSRVVAVHNEEIDTIRYVGGSNEIVPITQRSPAFALDHPTWSSDGSTIYWSEKASPSSPWRLMASPSSPGGMPVLVAGDDGFDYTKPDAGPNGLLVAQRNQDLNGTPVEPSDIVTYDPATRHFTSIAPFASMPSISPDGTKVAWVNSVHENDQIFTANLDGSRVTQITPNDGNNRLTPTWSPDGKTIAYAIVNRVYTIPAGGGTETAAGIRGTPAYQPQNVNHVVPLAGSNRFGTAVAISESHWATADSPEAGKNVAQSVTLSRSDTFADAVSGSALAAAKHGPLLMTPPTSLNADTWAEIQRVLGSTNRSSKTVYLLGSTGAISQATEDTIRAAGYHVSRLAGANRYATSVSIANEISTNPQIILAATGLNFPDALSAGAAAGAYDAFSAGPRAVVVLTADASVPTDTFDYVKHWVATNAGNDDAAMFSIGAQAGKALATRFPGDSSPVTGSNRYETAAMVARTFFGGAQIAGLTIGENWPDALAGGAFLGSVNGPLLLTPTSGGLNSDSASTLDVESGSINTVVTFGSLVNSAASATAGKWISGSAGFDDVLPSLAPTQVAAAQTRSAAEAVTATDKPTVAELKQRVNELK